MSAAIDAAKGGALRTVATPAVNPWVIAIIVAIATFMEVLDTTIANVALPYIAGGMGVSTDESSWVVTTYLVANAIILPASSYLAKYFGRKTFFLICLGLFTLSSILCGFAWNLESLLLFRIFQGLGGGGMVPVSQSILADSFPPQKRGQAFALFGVAVVVAPVVGPTLGGWLSDNWNWSWCFLINAPVGLAALIAVLIVLPQQAVAPAETRRLMRADGIRFDLIGFVLLATFLGSLELVLDRGLDDDWFGSSFIITFATLSALSFVLMIPWELTRRHPLLDIRIVGTRQFGSSFVVMLATGAILLATTQFLPLLVQQMYGYTATWAGLVLSPGGVVTMMMMVVVGKLSGKVQPKYLIAIGGAIVAFAMYQMTVVYGDLDFWFLARSRMLFGVGLPLIFIPINVAAYDGIAKERTDQASALINAARNTGSSIGVAIGANVLAHRQQFHLSRLGEFVVPSNPQFQETVRRMTQYFVAHGSNAVDANKQAIGWIWQQVQTQAGFLAYVDVFWTLALISASVIPLALLLRKVKLGGEAPMGH